MFESESDSKFLKNVYGLHVTSEVAHFTHFHARHKIHYTSRTSCL